MDTANIAVSVIVPVYNVASFLPRCLESVQRQTLKKLEIICVDDGSADDSCKIIEHRQVTDSRIRLFYQEHAGPGVARNLGIKSARGEYISFLDTDDYYYEDDALEKMYMAAKDKKADICSAYKMLTSDSREISDSKAHLHEKPSRDVWIDYIDYQHDLGFTNYIYRRNFLIEHSIVFPGSLYYEDPPFLISALTFAGRFLCTSTILYCQCRGHKTRILTSSQVGDLLDGMLFSLKIAHRGRYNDLYRKIIVRLNETHYEHIADQMTVENINRIVQIVTFDRKMRRNSYIKIFHEMIHGVREIQYEQYVFPFHWFPKNSKVIIYGAGIVGQALYYQATKYGKGYVGIVGMVDRNAKFMEKGMFPVSDPSEISGMHGEYVLIACKTEGTAISIRNSLKKHGFSDKNILWDEDAYCKEAFYQKALCSDFLENGGGKASENISCYASINNFK